MFETKNKTMKAHFFSKFAYLKRGKFGEKIIFLSEKNKSKLKSKLSRNHSVKS